MKRLIGGLLVGLVLSTATYAKGPVGIGDLKLGLTKVQVEQLAPAGGIELQGGLTVYETPASIRDKVPPLPANKQMFQTMLKTPWKSDPVKTTFTFTDGALTLIEVDLDDDYATMHTIKAQVASKYGEPEVIDSTNVEHCYTSAGTEDIKTGLSGWKWVQNETDGVVETTLHTYVLDSCIGRKYGTQSSDSIYLSIGKKAASANPF